MKVCIQCMNLKTSAAMSPQATRGQEPGGQENIELDYCNLGASRAEGGLNKEAGAQERDL